MGSSSDDDGDLKPSGHRVSRLAQKWLQSCLRIPCLRIPGCECGSALSLCPCCGRRVPACRPKSTSRSHPPTPPFTTPRKSLADSWEAGAVKQPGGPLPALCDRRQHQAPPAPGILMGRTPSTPCLQLPVSCQQSSSFSDTMEPQPTFRSLKRCLQAL